MLSDFVAVVVAMVVVIGCVMLLAKLGLSMEEEEDEEEEAEEEKEEQQTEDHHMLSIPKPVLPKVKGLPSQCLSLTRLKLVVKSQISARRRRRMRKGPMTTS